MVAEMCMFVQKSRDLKLKIICGCSSNVDCF